ncbi:bifunctional phosphoribosylaminoimidazolecarboxamide formyltransferase/IMP cyclohydrolase [Nocardiopsis sp. MG754419]|uniref:bifunctional phosphoribosylaminoimidazolecarboxamide formyltransferase/IMP cyclohydrolase n=1 Tax=Nocardiopsis sp. MG754419 TaxID=2259865 RepID=UPI001BA65F8D|nr:bifunctional phosphoribosylaminoimidazolecarboxamide formyltransferase/IMP cyclohydrolase [Nocardiopsis sp. MG754419]MBR8741266.1 bifunctional phosphoribosylaminoimidazolecarboxamide formyltransferase/inosine monophosphate cyclohydrolase [Nocardiopsis sp. MG754419]
MTQQPIRRALISVYDKTGLTELGAGLAEAGVEIVSTGSTAATLTEAGVAVTPVESVTGFPEIMEGRVKTLHPAVHAGLLADQGNPAHVATIDDLGIAPFDLVVVNLYPFSDTVASGASVADCIEKIDIGGPAMVRASAKNHGSVAIVVDPGAYDSVLEAVRDGGFTLDRRKALAGRAFQHTAAYDAAVADWFASAYAPDAEAAETGWPDFRASVYTRQDALRYGENPHQKAALYTEVGAGGGLAGAEQLHGKAMSYNNYVDADAALRAAYDFDEPCVAIIKHANPCGIAVGADNTEAHRKAHASDPVSAFGGVIATNREVGGELAAQIAEIFTEVVVAPAFTDEAVATLSRKKNIRLLVVADQERGPRREARGISGGLLVQDTDVIDAPGDDPATWTLATGTPADEATLADLAFAWRSVRAVKSNAILLASGGATVGVGMGQVNRVDSARLAVSRAAERVKGSVAASDAFFPFADGLEILTEAGVRAVVQPGGSVRDAEVVAAAEAAGVTMYFTGTRHFFH